MLISHHLVRLSCSAVLLSGAVACTSSDVDPDTSGGGAPGNDASGGNTSMGGDTAMAGSMGAAGAAGAAPVMEAARFRCEDTGSPKVVLAGDMPLILDFETGSLVLVDATGNPIADFRFGPVVNSAEAAGGTYVYQEVDDLPTFDTNVMRTAELVDDDNGGQALSITLANATGFGGGMGIFFFPCVDASAYTGVSFRARATLPARTEIDGTTVIPAGTVTMRIDVADTSTNSLDSIACSDTIPTDLTLCTRPQTTVVIGEEFTDVTLAWDDFDPGTANGTAIAPNGDNLLGLEWAIDNAFGAENDLVFVIDDVTFMP